jgi:KaiC/GvpD/RAD55 family RecA-like ATPase
VAKSSTSSDDVDSGDICMPDELMQFIKHGTYSLLIKGFAGTGKTTLALTILRALENNNNFFYISTRISPKQLFEYYPWLNQFVEQPKLPNGDGRSTEGTVLSSFEDARLDEPESLFERITNQLMDIASPIIVIDSWDAIASFMDKEARMNNERVLQTWRERAGAKLIFVSEHPADTTLDFLVDGIVELKQNYYESARIREIHLLKLRGIRIARPSYIYTLENSIFRSFAPYKPLKLPLLRKNVSSTNTLSATSDRIKSGYPLLDIDLDGGLPRKGIVLLELDDHVNTAAVLMFLGQMVSNFVASSNLVLFQPFDYINPQTIMEQLGTCISKKNLFKILWDQEIIGLSENLVTPRQKEYDPSLAAIANMKQKHSNKPILNIMGLDMLQKFYESNTKNKIEDLLTFLKTNTDLTIAVIRQTWKDLLHRFTDISDLHLRMLMIRDTLFLQSFAPASTLYSLVFDTSNGGGRVYLKPIV